MKEKLVDATINQGYTPDGITRQGGKLTNHHESYEHRRFKNDLCPSDEELKGFKQFMDMFYKVSILYPLNFPEIYLEQ
jgi:hypothetical protein